MLNLYSGTVLMKWFGDMLPTMAIGAVVLVAHRVITGRFDRWLVGGWCAMTVWICCIQQTFTAAWWERLATRLLA